MNMIKKTLAFTVAEILVAMSIVGVVAAMTIPTLHYNKTKKEYSVKLKNFYSRMQNAVEDMQVDKGSFKDMKMPDNTDEARTAWYLDNIDPYMGHQFVKGRKVYYKDGSSLDLIWAGGCLDVDYDVNGDKSPNRSGYDMYRFLYCFKPDSRSSWFGDTETFFGTYGQGYVATSTTRAQMIDKCKANPSWCSRLLQVDNWEYKQDYPYKF